MRVSPPYLSPVYYPVWGALGPPTPPPHWAALWCPPWARISPGILSPADTNGMTEDTLCGEVEIQSVLKISLLLLRRSVFHLFYQSAKQHTLAISEWIWVLWIYNKNGRGPELGRFWVSPFRFSRRQRKWQTFPSLLLQRHLISFKCWWPN